MSQRVGVIGLGAMGLNVARNLIQKGFEVYGCDVRDSACAALAEAGGTACATPAELGATCDVVIVLVVNAAQTDAVLFGDDGAAQTLQSGAVVIASATVPPAFASQIGARLAERDIHMLDCPLTGGVVGAEKATLTLLSSGPEQAYAACENVLAAISAKIYRFGSEHGLGSKVKVINQLLVGVHIAAAAEAVALGLREGVDADLLYDVLTHGAGNSWAFADRVPRILDGQYAAQTQLDIFVKDLGLVLDTARDSGFPTPLASTAYQMFASASAAGHGGEDDVAVIKTFPGITLPPARER
jgi:3-hydroxyisobutyrate dehydrogenase